MASDGDVEPEWAVREIWHEAGSDTCIVYRHRVRPRRWWNHWTRPVGWALIVLAIGWPILLLTHDWIRLGIAFAIADTSVAFVGVELIGWGARRWSADHDH